MSENKKAGLLSVGDVGKRIAFQSTAEATLGDPVEGVFTYLFYDLHEYGGEVGVGVGDGVNPDEDTIYTLPTAYLVTLNEQ